MMSGIGFSGSACHEVAVETWRRVLASPIVACTLFYGFGVNYEEEFTRTVIMQSRGVWLQPQPEVWIQGGV